MCGLQGFLSGMNKRPLHNIYKTIGEMQRETENWTNVRHGLSEAEIKTKFADPLNIHVSCKCQNQTDCLIKYANYAY